MLPPSFRVYFSHFKLMGLNIIRCNSRILGVVLRIKSENVINSLLIPWNAITWPVVNIFLVHLSNLLLRAINFLKKIVINSFLHNIKMKSSLVREHTFWTEASLLAKTNGKPDCDLFVGIFQRVVLATCICSELRDWLFWLTFPTYRLPFPPNNGRSDWV